MKRFPLYLLIIYVAVFIWGAINPYARDVWLVENATVWIVLLAVIILYVCKIRFSNTAYFLMAFFIIMHTIGGHYTFERVPFDAVTDFFNLGRNNYDRIAHFTVGLYAYPVIEYLISRKLVSVRWVAYLFGIFAIMSVAATYELFEWWYAIMADPTAGIAVLGSQGDIWDAQKDMLADTLGAIVAAIALFFAGKKK